MFYFILNLIKKILKFYIKNYFEKHNNINIYIYLINKF